ncbi:MAG: CopG family antitoxin [SAR202 cluster bacterium]|nr:CopG family antitoxin [SAR202 cluster bacterium]MDP6512847.1 CopG family antitoxin [SAR202 cluster bacterium]MDP6715932.1 CopG family antitoxin [SAR202 cluster bacterium]
MKKKAYRPASIEELEREALKWDQGAMPRVGWEDATELAPNASKSTAISLRVPTDMLTILKEFARRERIGYQVLMKRWLDDRIREERDKLREKTEQTASSSDS